LLKKDTSTLSLHDIENQEDDVSFALDPNIKKWDVLEVCIFLSTIGMDQYQKVFLTLSIFSLPFSSPLSKSFPF